MFCFVFNKFYIFIFEWFENKVNVNFKKKKERKMKEMFIEDLLRVGMGLRLFLGFVWVNFYNLMR